MAWTDTLRASSFRGVPFEVDTAGLETGRRIGIHEIPGSDIATTEDTGRKTRTISLEAYVIGEDAVAQSVALLEALEAEGPGLLVHPLYGEIVCRVQDARQTTSWDNGHVVLFSLAFVEDGELTFLALDTGSALDDAISAMDAATLAEVTDQLDSEGFSLFVLDAAIAAIDEVLEQIEAIVATPMQALDDAGDIVAEIAALKARATELAGAPEDFAAEVQSLLARIGDILGLRRLASGAGEVYTEPTPATADRKRAESCAYAARRAQCRYALSAACALLRDSELTVYDDAIRDRDAIAGLIADEEEQAEGDTLDALRSLRTALISDITSRVAGLPRITEYTPPGVMPAVNVAYALYGDANRDQEIRDRNDIVHPLFVPVEVLSVLTQ